MEHIKERNSDFSLASPSFGSACITGLRGARGWLVSSREKTGFFAAVVFRFFLLFFFCIHYNYRLYILNPFSFFLFLFSILFFFFFVLGICRWIVVEGRFLCLINGCGIEMQ